MTTDDETPQQPKLIKRWPYSDEDNASIWEIAKNLNNEDAKRVVRERLKWNVSAHYIGNLRREREGLGISGKVKVRLAIDDRPEVPGDGLERKISLLRATGVRERPTGVQKPEVVHTPSRQFKRDPKVVAWVELFANGACQLCNETAPFFREDGTPFLEVHHVIPLAENGPDIPENAVALCPNCHRRCHHGEDREKMKRRLKKKLRGIFPNTR